MDIPNSFADKSGTIQLSLLDENFTTVEDDFNTLDGTVTTLSSTVSGLTSSQWTTSGTDVYYNSGNVGIGTTAPNSACKLDINGGNLRLRYSGSSPTRIQYFNSGNDYTVGVSGGAAVAFHEVSGSQEIGFETHYVGNSHAERMRIDKSGNIGIGTTSPDYKLHVEGTAYFNGNALTVRGGSPTIYFRDTDAMSAMLHNNSNLLYVLRGGTDTQSWSQVNSQWPFTWNLSNNDASCGGSFSAIGNITGYASDVRLKENIVPISNALEKVNKLQGVTFDWKDEAIKLGFVPQNKEFDAGVLAQEVQEVLPQAVAYAPFDQEWSNELNRNVSKSGEDYLTVRYEKIVPLLIEAIKELSAEVKKLKGE